MVPLLDPSKVSAVTVTRGDVPHNIERIRAGLPYDEHIVWDNSKSGDMKFFGQFFAAMGAEHDWIYFQDDDLIFTEHERLLSFAEPDRFVSNMSEKWITDLHYYDIGFTGAGSIVPKKLIKDTFGRYMDAYGQLSEDEMYEAAFIFGALAPYKRVDLGFEILPEASAENRMWKQERHQTLKWEIIKKARSLRTVCLYMMVKNEEKNVERALRSAAGLYQKAAILDTGSTDRTREIAHNVLNDMGVEHTVTEKTFDPWDFAAARNESLDLAREMGCDFLLLMDGDEEWVDHDGTWPEITHDCILLDYDDDLSVPQPRMVRSWQPWEYRGRVHATLYCDEMRFAHLLHHPKIRHHGEVRHGDTKLKRDVEILREMMDEDPDDTRTVFNLAKALDGLNQDEEACQLFLRRSLMGGGSEEERWYAQYKHAQLLCVTTSFELGSFELLRAWHQRPHRADPLRTLSEYCTKIADEMPVPVGESFFMQKSHYKAHNDNPPQEG